MYLYGNQLISTQVDLVSGRSHNYRKAAVGWDGKPLTAQSNDGMYYTQDKLGNFYRIVADEHWVDMYGIVPENTPLQNSDAFERMMRIVPSTSRIRMGEGHYRFARMPFFNGFEGMFIGMGSATAISVPASCIGMGIGPQDLPYIPTFRDFYLYAEGKDPQDNGELGIGELYDYELGTDEPAQLNADGYRYHGLLVETLCNVINVEVKGFSGHGVKLRGNLYPPPGSSLRKTNTSMSYFQGVRASESGGCGFFITGLDASAVTFINCTAKDNAGRGFYDHSVLGCTFIVCQTEANEAGGFLQDKASAHSLLLGFYTEASISAATGKQNAPDVISHNSISVGGTHGNGLVGGLSIDGTNFSEINLGQLHLAASSLMMTSYNQTSGMEFSPQDTPFNTANHWAVTTGNADFFWMGLTGPGAVIPANATNALGSRVMKKSRIYVRDMAVGGALLGATKGLPFTDIDNETLRPGDIFTNTTEGEHVPRQWNVSKGGFITPPAYTEGLTASQTNSQQVYNTILQLSGSTTMLRPDTFLLINGVRVFFKKFADKPLDILYSGDFAYSGTPVPLVKADGSPLIAGQNVTAVPGSLPNVLTTSAPLLLNTHVNLKDVIYAKYAATDLRPLVYYGPAPDFTKLELSQGVAPGTNQSIGYAKAELRPVGILTGPEALRPALNYPGHIGTGYFNQDTQHLDIWLGSSWKTT